MQVRAKNIKGPGPWSLSIWEHQGPTTRKACTTATSIRQRWSMTVTLNEADI